MLRVQCDVLDQEVLVNDITSIVNGKEGIFVEYLCACGQPGLLITGANAHNHWNGHSPLAA